MAILNDFIGTVALTRDWPRFLLNRFIRANEDSRTFRLRNGQVIGIGADQAFVLNEIYRDRIYDVPDVALGSCRTIVDIGANVGVFALYAAARAPNAKIHCFEPATTTFALLERNLDANRVQVAAHKMAISTSCGAAMFYHGGTAAEWSLHENASMVSEEVQCIDLNRLLDLVDDEAIDFLKMDVEGVELDVLGGASDEQLHRIGALSVEWHHPLELLVSFADRLRRIGFRADIHISEGNIRYLKAKQLDFPIRRKDGNSAV